MLNDDFIDLDYFARQGQSCFMEFYIGRVHGGLCRRFDAKNNKYSKVGEHKNIFCIRLQDHPLTINQCLSYMYLTVLNYRVCSDDEFDLWPI